MRKIILVGYNKDIMKDELIGEKINLYFYNNNDVIENIFSDYIIAFNGIFKDNGIFFEDIFYYLDWGLRRQNNPEKLNCNEGTHINCFPSLLLRLEKYFLLNDVLVITNGKNKYGYLLSILSNVKEIDDEYMVAKYIKNNIIR